MIRQHYGTCTNEDGPDDRALGVEDCAAAADRLQQPVGMGVDRAWQVQRGLQVTLFSKAHG